MSKTNLKLLLTTLFPIALTGCGATHKMKFTEFTEAYTQADYCKAADTVLGEKGICKMSADDIKPSDFNEGMAVINVREGKRVYQTYMYESGEIMPLKLEYASQFENGLAKVETRSGRLCVIDKTGSMWDAYTEKLKRVNDNVVLVTEDSQEVKILRKLYKAPSEFKKLATKWFGDEMFIVSCVTQIEEGLKAKIDAGKVPSNFNEYVLKLKREIREKIALEKENETRYLTKEFREI